MNKLKLYMLLLGCKPKDRHIEQHDIFFVVGRSLKEVIPEINNFWPEAGKIHLDAWREVTSVGGFEIAVVEKMTAFAPSASKLFFLNLGGYKPKEFEEYHYKVLCVHDDQGQAIQNAKNSVFYKHKTSSHIDDKYGVDVDDVYEIEDILPTGNKEKYSLRITAHDSHNEDEWHIGYTKLSSL